MRGLLKKYVNRNSHPLSFEDYIGEVAKFMEAIVEKEPHMVGGTVGTEEHVANVAREWWRRGFDPRHCAFSGIMLAAKTKGRALYPWELGR